MSHVIELTDEQYKTLEAAAKKQGQTAGGLIAQIISDLETTATEPKRFETDEWLRHLGVSEDEIAASRERVRREAEMPYDADS